MVAFVSFEVDGSILQIKWIGRHSTGYDDTLQAWGYLILWLTPEPADVSEYLRKLQRVDLCDDLQRVRNLGYFHRKIGVGFHYSGDTPVSLIYSISSKQTARRHGERLKLKISMESLFKSIRQRKLIRGIEFLVICWWSKS